MKYLLLNEDLTADELSTAINASVLSITRGDILIGSDLDGVGVYHHGIAIEVAQPLNPGQLQLLELLFFKIHSLGRLSIIPFSP